MIWKPIETMPIDGTSVLLWDGKSYDVGNRPPDCAIGRWTYNKKDKQWNGHSISFKPTHWRTLPFPPIEVIHAPTVKRKE